MTLSLQKKHTLNAERYFRSLNILILDITKILEKRKFNSSFIFNILFLNFGLNNRNFFISEAGVRFLEKSGFAGFSKKPNSFQSEVVEFFRERR